MPHPVLIDISNIFSKVPNQLVMDNTILSVDSDATSSYLLGLLGGMTPTIALNIDKLYNIHLSFLHLLFPPFKYIPGDIDISARKKYSIINGYAQVSAQDILDVANAYQAVQEPTPQFDFEPTTPILLTAPAQSFSVTAKSTNPEYFDDTATSYDTIAAEFQKQFGVLITLSDFVGNVDDDLMKFEFKVNCNIPLGNTTLNGSHQLFATPDAGKALTINVDYAAN